MGKKRKAGARGAAEAPNDRSVSEPKVRLDIQSYKDVANSEDEFHLHRDKILLDEGPERKRQRKLAEQGKTASRRPGFSC
jgi:U3 small nucleolar RNA-associated protein 3